MKKLPKSKRLRIVITALVLNFIIFGFGVFKGADLSDLGIGLAALNAPLYAYVLSETWKPSKQNKDEK